MSSIVLFVIFFSLLLIGVPIAISLGLSSMIALLVFTDTPMMVLVQKTFSGVDSFTLLAIPLFILSGNVMSAGGVSQRLEIWQAVLSVIIEEDWRKF